MFNYSEIDKHVTVLDMDIIATWLISKNLGDWMVSNIDREQGQRIYNVHLTCGQNGFNRKVRIHDNNEVEVIEREKEIFWMS